jgi:hypothetical protein
LLKTQIEFVKWKIKQTIPARRQLKWVGEMIELVELVYALHAMGRFGDISIKKLFDVICEMFDCKIKNFYHLFWDIRNRTKGDRAVFIDKMKEALIQKMEEADNRKY